MGLLDTGPLLEARLAACCPSALGNVFSTADLVGVKEARQTAPALHVVLHSFQPVDDDGASDNRWREIWLVVVVVKQVRQGTGARAVRDAAPELIRETIAALDGWRCPGTVGLVRAISPPGPVITDGFGYFPLAFTSHVVTDGVQDNDF